jgi:hypothetical protein
MKTKPSDVSSYSYKNTSKASQINSMRVWLNLVVLNLDDVKW